MDARPGGIDVHETDAHKEADIWLGTLAATPRQRRLTFATMAGLLVAFCAVAPFATMRLPESDGFIPAVQSIIFVADLTIAVLLFTHFSVHRSRALLALANAYLFTAFIVVVHTLTFPRAFAPEGLVGAGLQTTAWLRIVWHFSLPAGVIGYVALKHRPGDGDGIRASMRSVVGCSVIGAAALALAILWVFTAADKLLPPLLVDRLTFSPLVLFIGAFGTAVCGIALVLLLTRKGSVLDHWLAISVAATTAEIAMVTFLSGGRFDLGWYTVRIFGVVASTTVLLALLTETERLHARLSMTLRALERERDNKLLSAQAASAAIAHEIRQPLAAIAASNGAALRFLKKAPPDLGQVRAALELAIGSCHQASEMIDDIRSLFRRVDEPGQPVDLNEVIASVIHSHRQQLRRGRVEARHEPAAGLPLVRGHKAQLQEVVVNLVHNAIEAMATTTSRDRLLKLTTQRRGDDAIVVQVLDTGPGIEPERLDEIFDAFVTTKPQGTGLGLAICRMIVEHHGGELTVSSDGRSGALFEFVLPVMSSEAQVGQEHVDQRKPVRPPSGRPAARART